MGLDTSEIPRSEFTRHELFILKYAKASKPIPADPPTVDLMVREGFIERTKHPKVHALTETGLLACLVVAPKLEELGES